MSFAMYSHLFASNNQKSLYFNCTQEIVNNSGRVGFTLASCFGGLWFESFQVHLILQGQMINVKRCPINFVATEIERQGAIGMQ